MSRYFAICLVLSVTAMSFLQSSVPSQICEHLKNMSKVIADKPFDSNYFSLSTEFRQCEERGADGWTYNKKCLEKVLTRTDQAAKNNLKLIGTGMVVETAVILASAVAADLRCPNTARGLRIGFNALAVLPFLALCADTFGLLTLRNDIKDVLPKN